MNIYNLDLSIMEIKPKKDDNIKMEDVKVLLTQEDKIDHLIKELEENTVVTKKLHKMLERNNECTEYLYTEKKVELSDWQQFKNFMIAVLANIIGNIIDFKSIFGLGTSNEKSMQQQLNNYKNGRY